MPMNQCGLSSGSLAKLPLKSAKIGVNGDPKVGFMLIGVITASGEKLPLFLIVKGLTQKCHKQFGRCFPGTIDHSKSGWAN
jgi:hypothetical protein